MTRSGETALDRAPDQPSLCAKLLSVGVLTPALATAPAAELRFCGGGRRHCRILYGAFEYYGALYSEEGTHDMDIFNMTMNAFYAFASQCKIPSADCPMRDIETIWVLVNANEMDATVRAEDKHNSKTTLNRQEFLQCIVRIAINKYCRSGKVADVSQAVEKLCSSISGRLPMEALQACMRALQHGGSLQRGAMPMEHVAWCYAL